VPDNYRWGVQAGPGGVRPASDAVMDALQNAAGQATQFFADMGQTLSDMFEAIRARAEEAWTFIVRKAEEAFEFVCALGNKIKRFVLQTLEEIGGFFTWLWDQIETGLERAWEFLKFVFDWEWTHPASRKRN
jgi:hypothetical protein